MENRGPKLHYFISDVHLGVRESSPTKRERAFANFLTTLPTNVESLYLLGDIFDFWYEYRDVIPRGFSRTLGALGTLSDRGVKLYFIRGNHDYWIYNYLQEELQIELLEELSIVEIGRKRFLLGHGDELMGERGHLFIKRLFRNRTLQRLFSALHPRWAFSIAHGWSKRSRLATKEGQEERGERGEGKRNSGEESLFSAALHLEKMEKIDYFIFGHLHKVAERVTPKGAKFFVLGEWLKSCKYLIYDQSSDRFRWDSANLNGRDYC